MQSFYGKDCNIFPPSYYFIHLFFISCMYMLQLQHINNKIIVTLLLIIV
jgi:hypothetical protein